ncbi:MAG: PAS domain-containing protein, partial [Capsulimonas sp.]|uniref:PAS domain-containing protein n=1 Tax=Capsulimonas sp. TaxID=2494211 RepID=UPI003264A1E7
MTKPKQVEEEYGLGAVIPANETRDADGAALLAQEVIDTIRKPLLVLGDGMRVRSANRSYCNVFQALREDVEQSCFYDLDGGQWDTPRMRELLEHVWEHEAPFEDLELQSEFPRIGAKTVLVYARRLIHQGENSRLILLALEDITERRRAEQLLAAVDSYAQNIVDTVREPLLMLDPTLRVRSANRAFYQTFQVTPEETEGCLIYELGNRQWDIPGLRTLLEEIIPQKSVFNDYELAHDFPSIGRRVMLLNARELRAGNHTEVIVLALEDITERRRAEQVLAAVESYAQNIVDTVREPLLMLDPTLRVRSANRAFYQTFHVSAEETEGCLIYELGNRQWDIPGLRTLLEEIIPQKSVFNDYELAHDF